MAGLFRPGRRAAFGFVFVAVVLDMMAMGIVGPVLPGLIMRLIHGDAPRAARYLGWFMTLWAFMQFIFQPVMGSLSDRFGRRPVMLASMFGLAADYVVMALAPTVGWLLVGRAISGVTSSTFATANAYIADVTPPEERSSRFGILGAAFGIGFVAGPALGGLLGQIDPRLPFWGAGGLCFLNGLYGLFVVPESHKKENRAPFSFKLANPVGSFHLYRSKAGFLGLAGVIFFYYLAHQVLQSTWVVYAAYRYHWQALMMGLSLGVVGVGSIVVQVVLVRPAVARLGERLMLVTGLFCGASGMALFAVAPSGWLFLAAIPVFSLMGLFSPGIQGLMSRSVTPSEQGRLQGANASISAIASMMGPILFTEVFARTVGPWSAWAPVGLPFIVASGFLVAALALAAAVVWRMPSPASAAA